MYRLMITAALAIVYITTAIISVKGFAAFFNASILIYSLGIGLEVGKLVVIIYIHREWKKIKGWGFFDILIIGILMILTITEVLGFLSQAHGSGTKDTRSSINSIKQLEIEQRDLRDQLATMKDILNSYPKKGYGSAKAKIFEKNRKVSDRLLQIPGELSRLSTDQIQSDENPVFSVAEIFGISSSTITIIFIGMVVLVLEMLSLRLAIAASSLWMKVGDQRSEVRGRRSEIGGQRSEVRGRRAEIGSQRSAEINGQNRSEKVAEIKAAESAEIKTDQKWPENKIGQNRNGQEKRPEIYPAKRETAQDKTNGRNWESILYQGTANLKKSAEPESAEKWPEVDQIENRPELAKTGPEKTAETKTAQSNKGQYLEKFQKRHNLSADEIADITERKKTTTVVGWLENPDSIPVKAIQKLRGWHGDSKTVQV